MITFKDYLEEMSGQEIVARHMDSIHPDKRPAFRKHLAKARSNKMPLAAAIAQARVGIGEEVELEEMSKETLASAKEKALQRIQKALKKGDKHTAVKDAKFASKVDKKLDESKMDMNADELDWFDQTCRACGSGKYHATQDQSKVKCNGCGHESPRFVKNTNKPGPKNISSKVVGMSQSKRAKAMGLM